MLNLQHNFDLTAYNTLHLTSHAKSYVILNDKQQLAELTALIKQYPKYFVLGGGSNLILPEFYDGLVIHNQLYGKTCHDDGESYLMTAQAGENWDQFVAWCIDHGGYGLENLSLIPGTVGAAPVQNIGAYGVEVKDYIEYITVYDWRDGNTYNINNAECQFSYRNSYLKSAPYYLVLSVTFRLPKLAQLNCNYGDIKTKLEQLENPTALGLREIIIATRRNKLPDPLDIGNAGSFFHNPIIPSDLAMQLQQQYPTLPVYPTNNPNFVKIPAGWLIDNLGLKGITRGNLGTYHKQALVVVNHGTATKDELIEFATYIQKAVLDNYHISLQIEPIMV